MGTVLVIVEPNQAASMQMFTAAKQIGGDIHALVLGGAGAANLPCDVAYQFDCDRYLPLQTTDAIEQAIQKTDATTVLMVATQIGRDVAPRVAARCNAALLSDCTSMTKEDGVLQCTRPVFGGKFVATEQANASINVITIRSNVFPATNETGSPELKEINTEADSRESISEVIAPTDAEIGVADAEIIVSGGRPLGSEENFKMLYELAHTISDTATVGASRAAVDEGYQPVARQVGLTGTVVAPKLYIACGIDGAIQHLAGMRGSEVIVAINTNPDAPIFNVATYGCVCDLFELVPAITAQLQTSPQSA